MNKCCSFTGHRQIVASHIEKLPELLTRAINFAYSEGCREFFSGGAMGFDLYAAREVIRFRQSHPDVRLVMVLPCADQDAGFSSEWKSIYRQTLDAADEIITLSEEYTPDCMRVRNQYLAEHCQILVAYLYKSRSGAGQTVRMAERLGKRVYNLYPTLNSQKN